MRKSRNKRKSKRRRQFGNRKARRSRKISSILVPAVLGTLLLGGLYKYISGIKKKETFSPVLPQYSPPLPPPLPPPSLEILPKKPIFVHLNDELYDVSNYINKKEIIVYRGVSFNNIKDRNEFIKAMFKDGIISNYERLHKTDDRIGKFDDISKYAEYQRGNIRLYGDGQRIADESIFISTSKSLRKTLFFGNPFDPNDGINEITIVINLLPFTAIDMNTVPELQSKTAVQREEEMLVLNQIPVKQIIGFFFKDKKIIYFYKNPMYKHIFDFKPILESLKIKETVSIADSLDFLN
jgi:hypothetical protein